MTSPFRVMKFGTVIPLSTEQVAEARETATAIQAWMSATPAERDQWRAEADRERAEIREATPTVPLTLESLLDRMCWSREYAEHLVQPYCDCGDSSDGWEHCQHTRDLGLTG